MQLLIKTMLLVSLLLFNSCDNAATNENNAESLTDSTAIKVLTDVEDSLSKETELEGKVITGVYEGATTYAAVSDYKFITADDELILVRGNTYGEAETIDVPENMLEEITEELEGPPGANPDLIGKKFKIYYNADDTPVKIELIE